MQDLVERQWGLQVQIIPLSFSLELNYLSNPTVSLLYEFPFSFQKLIHQIKTSAYHIFQPDPLCSFGIVSSTDESSESEEAKATTQEEYEVDWTCSWIKAGGMLAFAEKEAQGLLSQVFLCLVLLSLSDCSSCCSMAKPGLCDRPLFSFPGATFTAASQFVERGGPAVGGGGITQSRTDCGRIRGRGFIQASEGCSIAFLPCPLPHLHLKYVIRPLHHHIQAAPSGV